MTNNARITVGTGVTIQAFSDRYAGTVIRATPRHLIVQQDAAIRVDSNGTSQVQDYRYERDPQGLRWHFTLRKNGTWILQGKPLEYGGMKLTVGERRAFYDQEF